MKSNNQYYDPESLITGKEIRSGMTYADHRDWPISDDIQAANLGNISPDEVAIVAPRKKKYTPEQLEALSEMLGIIADNSENERYLAG